MIRLAAFFVVIDLRAVGLRRSHYSREGPAVIGLGAFFVVIDLRAPSGCGADHFALVKVPR